MELRIPPPIIGDYLVMELKQAIDKRTGKASLMREPKRRINTLEMPFQVGFHGLFIIGWSEIHYKIYYNNQGVPLIGEDVFAFVHPENIARIDAIRNYWSSADSNPLLPNKNPEPITQSLEQELLAMGWEFEYRPGDGPAYPKEWDKNLKWLKPETSIYFGQEEDNITQLFERANTAPGPVGYMEMQNQLSSQSFQPPTEAAPSRLESKIDSLSDDIRQLIGVISHALIHDSGNGERRSFSAPISDGERSGTEHD